MGWSSKQLKVPILDAGLFTKLNILAGFFHLWANTPVTLSVWSENSEIFECRFHKHPVGGLEMHQNATPKVLKNN